jgi:hypothetical protein
MLRQDGHSEFYSSLLDFSDSMRLKMECWITIKRYCIVGNIFEEIYSPVDASYVASHCVSNIAIQETIAANNSTDI